MGTSILFTICSVTTAYRLIRWRRITSISLKLALSYLVAQVVCAYTALILSSIFNPWIDGVLGVSSLTLLFALLLSAALSLRSNSFSRFESSAGSLLQVGASLFLAWLLVSPHLNSRDNMIWYSNAYWDISAQYTMVQSFHYGDNFPPQNEGRAGLPMIYHFMYALLVALYSSLGLELVGATQFVATMTLAALLLGIIGLCEEWYGSSGAGWLAVLMFITSGSLRFLHEIELCLRKGCSAVFDWSYLSPVSPLYFSTIVAPDFRYDGNLHNIFYVIAEKHLVFGLLYLLGGVCLLLRYRSFSRREIVLAGVFFGLSFLWHSHLGLLLGLAILVLLYQRPQSTRLRYLAGSFWFTYGAQAALSSWAVWRFAGSLPGERFPIEYDASFLARNGALSLLIFYGFGFGLRLPAFAAAAFETRRMKHPAGRLLILFTVVALMLAHSVSLGGISSRTNYKWLKAVQLMSSIMIGAYIWSIAKRGRVVSMVSATVLSVFCISGGVIELIAYTSQKPEYYFAAYPSEFVSAIRRHMPREAVVLTAYAKEILLAGRKTYFAGARDVGYTNSYFMGDAVKADRLATTREIHNVKSIERFCELVTSERIDFVEVDAAADKASALRPLLSVLPYFTVAHPRKAGEIHYLATAPCKSRLSRP